MHTEFQSYTQRRQVSAALTATHEIARGGFNGYFAAYGAADLTAAMAGFAALRAKGAAKLFRRAAALYLRDGEYRGLDDATGERLTQAGRRAFALNQRFWLSCPVSRLEARAALA